MAIETSRLQRNALLALTNQKDSRAFDWSSRFLKHEEPSLRIVAAWSHGELQRLDAIGILRERLANRRGVYCSIGN